MVEINKEPMISVIMSVHNGRPYLGEAIQSVLTQTFSDFEFIIIDDGSTDGSIEDISYYADQDQRIRIFSQSNKGLASALNVGLSMARGKYIARMDADDLAYPERLDEQLICMDARPNLVLLSASFDYIDVSGCFLKHHVANTNELTISTQLIEEGNQFCHPCAMINKEVLLKVGGYRSLVSQYAQDYDLWLRLSEVGTVSNLKQSLLKYRVHRGQISASNVMHQRRAAEVYKLLARQRRLHEKENLAAAIAEVDKNRHLLMNDVARIYIKWSSLFYRMGDINKAAQLLIRAILTAPFSSHAYQVTIKFLFELFGRKLTL